MPTQMRSVFTSAVLATGLALSLASFPTDTPGPDSSGSDDDGGSSCRCGDQECGPDPVCGQSCGVCADGECVEGRCEEVGTVVECGDTACPAGHYCDLASGECAEGCAAHAQCGAHERCDMAAHVCECEPDFHRCGDACVSGQSPGSCGQRCEPCPAPEDSSALCVDGACGFGCDPGFHRCGEVCSPDDSPASCGDRCEPCPAETGLTATCVERACSVRCDDPATHGCDGRCVDSDDPATCGDRCDPCPTDPRGEAVCVDGACGLACDEGALLCGGRCAPCPASAATVSCGGATCVADSCLEGHYRCDASCCPWDAETVDLYPTLEPEVAVGSDGTPWAARGTGTVVSVGRRGSDGWHVLPNIEVTGRIIDAVGLRIDQAGEFRLWHRRRTVSGQDPYGYDTFRFDLARRDQDGYLEVTDAGRSDCGRAIDGHQSQGGGFDLCHVCLDSYYDQEVRVGSRMVAEAASSSDVFCAVASPADRSAPVVGFIDLDVQTLKLFAEDLDEGGWGPLTTYPLEPDAHPRMDLDVDRGGAVHIIYVVGDELRTLVYRDQAWSEATIGAAADSPSWDNLELVLDGSGRGHALVSDRDGIHYLQQRDAGWSDDLVDPDDGIYHVSAAVDPDGRPHFVYHHHRTESTRYFAP